MMERSYSNCAYVTRPALCETKHASRTAIAVEFALHLECSLFCLVVACLALQSVSIRSLLWNSMPGLFKHALI